MKVNVYFHEEKYFFHENNSERSANINAGDAEQVEDGR